MSWLAKSAQDLTVRLVRETVLGVAKATNPNVLLEGWTSDLRSVAAWGRNGHGVNEWFWIYSLAPNGVENFKMFSTALAAKAEYDFHSSRWLASGYKEASRIVLNSESRSRCPVCGHGIG